MGNGMSSSLSWKETNKLHIVLFFKQQWWERPLSSNPLLRLVTDKVCHIRFSLSAHLQNSYSKGPGLLFNMFSCFSIPSLSELQILSARSSLPHLFYARLYSLKSRGKSELILFLTWVCCGLFWVSAERNKPLFQPPISLFPAPWTKWLVPH